MAIALWSLLVVPGALKAEDQRVAPAAPALKVELPDTSNQSWLERAYDGVLGWFKPHLIRPQVPPAPAVHPKVSETFLQLRHESQPLNQPHIQQDDGLKFVWERSFVTPELVRTSPTESDISHFRYCPPPVYNPRPPDASATSLTNLRLSWSFTSPVLLNFDVYLEYNNPAPRILVAQGLTVNYLDVNSLQNGTYYWQVVCYDPNDNCPTSSPVWSFTVNGTPGPTNTPGPGTPTDTPIPTGTPDGTMTPTPTSTVTPTPEGVKPFVQLAGYFDTYLTAGSDGFLNFIAVVNDADQDVQRVALFANGIDTGVELRDDGSSGDFGVNDTIYGIAVGLSGRDLTMPFQTVLEIRAIDSRGNQSDLWPYLNVNDGTVRARTSFERVLSQRERQLPEADGFLRLLQKAVDQGGALDRPASVRNPVAPKVAVAGYWDTDLNPNQGRAELTLLAYVMGGVSGVQSVEMYFNSMPTGVFLFDDGQNRDFSVGDGVYGLHLNMHPTDWISLIGQRFQLELVASDFKGNRSDVWPYLVIH